MNQPKSIVFRDGDSSDETEDGNDLGMKLENAFQKAGEFGVFQKRFFIMIVIYQVFAAFHTLCITFVGLEPEWRCFDQSNLTSDNKKCAMYEDGEITCIPLYTDRFYSIAQEWNLICDESYKINLTQSCFFLGTLIGCYVLGYLADKIGRRKVVIGYLIGLGLVQLLVAISPGYYFFALGRFSVGFLIAGGMTAYVLVCEIIGPSQRSLLAVTTGTVFALGFGFLALFAYLIPTWRGVTLLCSIGTIAFVFFSKYIPESPRWLFVTGRELEAKQAMMDIANTNGNSLPPEFSLKVPQEPPRSIGFLDFFSHGKVRLRMLLLMLEWFTVCMVYYGLSLGVGTLSSNLYLAFTLSGFIEVPSNLFVLLSLERLGRKWSNIGFLAIGGCAGVGCSFVQFTGMDSTGNVQLLLSLLGKFFISSAFSVLFTYTPELLPTEMRNFGMGIVNVCARSGGIIAPLIILLDNHTAGLSMLIMGGLSVFTSLLCMYLPETLNAPLPDTLAELVT